MAVYYVTGMLGNDNIGIFYIWQYSGHDIISNYIFTITRIGISPSARRRYFWIVVLNTIYDIDTMVIDSQYDMGHINRTKLCSMGYAGLSVIADCGNNCIFHCPGSAQQIKEQSIQKIKIPVSGIFIQKPYAHNPHQNNTYSHAHR